MYQGTTSQLAEKLENLASHVSGHGFIGCGKTQNGGRRGFHPPHKAYQINEGFIGCGKTRKFSQLCIRARLQPCRKRNKTNVGL
jgi:hypothetical protein